MQVPDTVNAAAVKPLFSHRSAPMMDLLGRLESGCRPLFGTAGADVLFQAASGTGAMESAIANLTSPGEEIIVIVGGTFAQRWVDIGRAYGLTVQTVETEWRTGISLGEVEAAISRWPNADVVFITWSESSTGVLLELAQIGKFLRSRNKIVVADAVSGLAVSPLQMDDWSIDVVVAGSQKGLLTPPGLGVVAIGSRAWEKNSRSKSPRFYWDWKKYKAAVPFTPALSLLFQLEAALDYIHREGKELIFKRRAEIAERVRQLVRQSGMEVYALNPGNGITGAIPPSGFDITGLIRRLDRDFGIQIAGGLGRLKGSTFRIGHVGHLSDEEVDYFIDSFQRCLK